MTEYMILEAARGLREIKKPLTVCGDTTEMNKKLLSLFFFSKDMHKVKWDEIWTIIATRPDCVELDKFFFSKVECTGICQYEQFHCLSNGRRPKNLSAFPHVYCCTKCAAICAHTKPVCGEMLQRDVTLPPAQDLD